MLEYVVGVVKLNNSKDMTLLQIVGDWDFCAVNRSVILSINHLCKM